MNKIFEEEWGLYRQTEARPAFHGVVAHIAGGHYEAPVEIGEIRIFADMNRPFVALIVADKGTFGYEIVPVSPFTVPASAREILIGERVYQLWNTCTAARTFVEHSWLVDEVTQEDFDDIVARLDEIPVGAVSQDEIAAAYEREFRVAGGNFRFLRPLVRKPTAAWWRTRTTWSIAASLMICCGIGGLLYLLPRHDAETVRIVCAADEARDMCCPGAAPVACEGAPEEEEVGAAEDFDLGAEPLSRVAVADVPGESTLTVGGSALRSSVVLSPVRSHALIGRCPILAPGENYATADENPFEDPTEKPLSTFGLDVDTTSYTLMRSSIVDFRRLPERDSVRIEEYVNYFQYAYPQPKGEHPIAVSCELAACPWNAQHQLMRVGVQAKNVDEAKLPPCNLTFLVDVSGSMEGPNRIGLLKRALKMLVGRLREQDHVAIVTYANDTAVRLPSVSGREKKAINQVIDTLTADGGTAGGAGLQLAYAEAKKNFDKKANNRVILVTDGDFNIGISSPKELEEFITRKRESGIFLTVFGVGRGNFQDANMKKLANAGNGNYAYLDSILEAKKVMLTEFGGTMMTVAKDVKLQIEFNPAEVGEYRLLGYENGKLAARDFNDDKKDAGEVGAGHTMTAFYEIVPPGNKTAKTDTLKYQENVAKGKGELCTVKLRYKAPDGDKSVLMEESHKAADITQKTPGEDFRFASAVAEFALLLKGSAHKGNASFEKLIERARNAKGEDREGYRAEFIRLAERAEMLSQQRKAAQQKGGKPSEAVEIEVQI